MVFSSLIFISGFLPPCVILCVLFRKNEWIQNVILLAASLVFYAWGDPRQIVLFAVTILLNWLLTLVSEKAERRNTVRITGICTILMDISILVWFKYAGWLGQGLGITIGGTALPLGISFFTFQEISYVADVMLLRKHPAEKNPINFALYIAFFPQLIEGPIVRFGEIQEQIRNRRIGPDLIEQGAFRFLYGFCKKVLIADTLAIVVDKAFSSGSELGASFAWLGAVAYMLQLFIDFSGYSDMAVGLGAMFGIKIPENFNCPYRARSIRDFWRRWHITLSSWFRDYVYIPLGGNRKGEIRTVLNLAAVWLLTGIWHGANYTFVLWGVIYGVLVYFEKAADIDRRLKQGRPVFRITYRIFTLIMVMLLWVLFRSADIVSASAYIRNMFSFGPGNADHALLYLRELKWAFIGGIILSAVPVEKIMNKRTILWPLMLVLFIISVSYLVKGTFSPFLYFNF